MVALGPDVKVSGTAIQKEWATKWPGKPTLSPPEKQGNTLSFCVGKFDVIYGFMPAPIPWSELKRLCAECESWPTAAEVLRPHKRHVIVTVSGGENDVERVRCLTKATFAIVATCQDALGVYWTASDQLIKPETFCETVNERIKVGIGPSSFGSDGENVRLIDPGKRKSSPGIRMTTYGLIHSVISLLVTIGMGVRIYSNQPQFLQGSIFRHFILVPATVISGFIFLVTTDNFLQNRFGLHSFTNPESEAKQKKRKKRQKE